MCNAIEQASRILDWHEHLTEEETPPEWMCPLEEELVIWFERVKEDREARHGGGSSSDDGPKGPMDRNEWAEGMK